jgi:hydroxymethylglutaryl-CoA lyase
VIDLTQQLLDCGLFEVAVSDTIGIAHPGQVRSVLTALTRSIQADHIALHFHDTRGTALANVLAALEFGVRTFDASAGGLGGCPYAPGASGNLATEDLLYLLHGLGYDTGVDLAGVMAASQPLERLIGHALPSRMVQATLAAANARRSPAT